MNHASRMQNPHGFTMIELLLVLVIIGILAALVVPKFTGRMEKAKIRATEAQLANFKTAITAFEIESGRFPRTDEGLDSLVEKPNDIDEWSQQMEYIPKDPWGSKFVYVCPGRHNSSGYDLSSLGPDKQSDTADDIHHIPLQKE